MLLRFCYIFLVPRISNPWEISGEHIDNTGRLDIVWWQRFMVCNVYFIEWEFGRIIPLSADRGISVGALICGGHYTCNANSISVYICVYTCMLCPQMY